ncbi:hypothetical protein GCM10027030_21450 [Luteococcus sediminum]
MSQKGVSRSSRGAEPVRATSGPLVAGVQEPPAGVDFAHALTGPDQSPLRPVFGALMAFSLYAVAVPMVAQLVVWMGWLMGGRPGPFGVYLREALAFEHIPGLVGAHLGLALLTLISLGLVRLVHGRRVEWGMSVQPGMRWRYLLLCLPVAAVVLNGVLLVGSAGSGFHLQPQAHVAWWLLAVLLTAPLQAAGEEFFFRGYLLQATGSLASQLGGGQQIARIAAVVGSSLVFALFHGVQNPALFVDRFGFGLLAGLLVLRTGGLEAGIACHVANNLFAFGWAALGGGIAEARALQSIGWAQAVSDLTGFALFALCAAWIAGRMNLASRNPLADRFGMQPRLG